MKKKYIAVYHNDEFVMVGTEKECAEKLGLQINTLRYYATPTRAKRMAKQKRNKYSGYLVLKLDDEEIEDNGIK